MDEYNFTDEELTILNTNTAIKLMMQQGDHNRPDRVLRYIKYENELKELQEELIKLQTWVIANRQRVCILYEGRDAAGKGGAIRRTTHHLNPRHYRIVALPKPTIQEKGQWYFQRYVTNLPNPGEIALFDRSWYNRAILEPVNDFCTEDEYQRFMEEVNNFESMITKDGIILIKFYFSITKEEQEARFEDIKSNPLKKWKMSPVDAQAQELWDVYTEYKDRMFELTNTENNPWVIIKANRKTAARIKAIRYVLEKVPYSQPDIGIGK
jgi:polyphosphate kinase 2